MRVLDLRAEYTVDLLGTEVVHPRLSWRIESDAAGVKQASYRIRTSPSAQMAEVLWDSGDVASEATVDIACGGAPLTPMQRIWWTVDVTDTAGAVVQSQPAWFEAGLLAASDWHADWIEAEDAFAAADRAADLNWVWSETALDDRPHAFRLEIGRAHV